METPQISESQDNCTNIDTQFTESTESQKPEKGDVEATCEIETESSQPDGVRTSLPADGAIETNMEDLSNEPNNDQTQAWPPAPEDDSQTDRDECQEEVKTNLESCEDVLTPVQDADGVEHDNLICREEEDSVVFLSQNSEEQNTACKPAAESGVDAQNVQQEELELRSLNENEVERQVCVHAPPPDTVTGERANPEQDIPACTENKEPLTMTEARGDGEEEEGRERGETGEERKQTGGAEEERQAYIKDQRPAEDKAPGETETHPNTKAEGKVGKMDVADHVDDSQSDSGVSADFSPNGARDASDCTANLSESPPNETPIEREIRLAMMREQNLRRDRGLDDAPDRTKEFVEIPVRKPILSQDPKFSPRLGKDRQFAGKKMLMEINAEAEREKVLVDLGRLPGFYDKGMEVQVQEKKLLFESLQDLNAATSNGEQAAGIQDLDYSVDIKQRLMQFSQNFLNPPEAEGLKSEPSAVGPGLTEATVAQVIIIETTPIFTPVPDSNRETSSKTNGGSSTDGKSASTGSSSVTPVETNQRQSFGDKDDIDLTLVKENPFFKLRSSVCLLPQVEQDIKEAKERERELQMQRNSLYGETVVEPENKAVEIERTTVMDSEKSEGEKTESKAEHETTSTSEEILSPKQTNLNPTICQTETSTTPTSVRQSTGKLELTWPPPQNDEEKQQSEKASRTPRQRTPLLDRWESGLVNGHVEDKN